MLPLVAKNGPQLQVSPSGFVAPLSLMPEMSPILFLTGQATLLFAPPSVPRSNTWPDTHTTAWRTRLPAGFE